MAKENETIIENYGYYSKVLNKPFDTVEDLKKAEAEYEAAQAEKQKLAEVKKARAEEVQSAYAEYVEACKTAKQIVADAQSKAADVIKAAEDKYNELKKKFINDYNSFHMSYYNNNGNENISVSDLVDSIFDCLRLF